MTEHSFDRLTVTGRLRAGRLHGAAVGEIVKRALGRAGFATQAAKNGATAFDIMRQTGHSSVQTVSRYVREAQIFRDAPAGKLGLSYRYRRARSVRVARTPA